MFLLSSRSLLWRGVLGIVIGIIAIAWPGVTVGAVVFIFAVLVFADSLLQLALAFDSEGGWQVVGHILVGIIDIAAGVVTIAWPGITAYVLTIWIGVWAIVFGVGEFGMSFSIVGTAGNRFLLGLTGLLSVALGVVLLVHPDEGTVALAEVFGLFSLAYGVTNLVLSFQAQDLDSGRTGTRRTATSRTA